MKVYGRTISTGIIVGLLASSPLSSGHAFRLEASRGRQDIVANVAAFDKDGGSKVVPRDLLLTPREVKHIRWCASQHPSYHATDNSILGQLGNRQQCVSPVWDVVDIGEGNRLIEHGRYQVSNH